MKKVVILMFAVLMISFASADIIIHQQPDEVYNLGDTINIPLTITTLESLQKTFSMNLICGGKKILMYQNDINLPAGGDKTIEASIVLTKERIGETLGTCKIKASLGSAADESNNILTNDFEISDAITIISTTKQVEFNPGDSILIKGDATKKNGHGAEGLISIQIGSENSTDSISQIGTINEGFFSVNITFPATMRAGAYLVKLDAYEKDLEGFTTNTGYMNYNIKIHQVPTSLEIFTEQKEIEPGTSINVKTILHDQTGDAMPATSIITIKKETGEILEQTEKATEEILEFPVSYNEEPANWTIVAVSSKLTSETDIIIKEKKDIKVEIINNTVIITNIGNVIYDELALIKIGEETVDVNLSLDVDESQEYKLSAPDGEYQIEILSNGESKLTDSVTLTGKSIDVKEIKNPGVRAVIRHPISWIFIIAILGFVAFMVLKKGYKKSFFGKISFKKKPKKNLTWENRAQPIRKGSLINSKNKAHLSLSIKGEKQSSSVVCLKIKNLKDIQSKKGNAEETLQKIVDEAEESKAATYETGEDLFFILNPTKTRTFKNEKTALAIAQKAEKILKEHNKLFHQKIEFGISVNEGNIIAKQEKDILEFMSLGTLITTAKKIASASKEEILLNEKIKQKLGGNIRTKENEHGKLKYYSITEIKSKNPEHAKFIKNFLKSLEKKD